MSDVNVITIVGRLCKDPESRDVGTAKVCQFRIGSNKRISSEKELSLYIDVNVWGKYGEICQANLAKGRAVAVSGYLRQDQWGEGDKKQTKTYIEADTVQFLDKKSAGNESSPSASSSSASSPETPVTSSKKVEKPMKKPATTGKPEFPF